MQRRNHLSIVWQRERNIEACIGLAKEFINIGIVQPTSQPGFERRTKQRAQLPSNIVDMCACRNAVQNPNSGRPRWQVRAIDVLLQGLSGPFAGDRDVPESGMSPVGTYEPGGRIELDPHGCNEIKDLTSIVCRECLAKAGERLRHPFKCWWGLSEYPSGYGVSETLMLIANFGWYPLI